MSEALQRHGHPISQRSVYTLRREGGYTLQVNRKRDEGASHPDRNAQFEYIYQKVPSFLARTQPVISVDAKKKENLGNFKNPGQDYHPAGKAPRVRVYDFPDPARGKASPYGVYDLAKDRGWVRGDQSRYGGVGRSHDSGVVAANGEALIQARYGTLSHCGWRRQ